MQEHAEASWSGKLKKYTLLIAVSVLCGCFLYGKLQGLHLLPTGETSGAPTLSASPIIVTQLQSLNRLETASQVSQQVVEANADRGHFPAFLGQDRLLMQVQTEMIAGIDMSRLTAHDILVQGKAVTVRVPAPELFSVRIDDEHTKVFSRERGWLVFTPDVNLESQARLKVLADARATGPAQLFPTARINAETSLRQLLANMGFARVKIDWNDHVS